MKDMTDVLYAATRLVTESRFGSPSMLVRCLKKQGVRVTFGTAVNLLDQMNEAGIVGPAQGSLARDVLMNTEQAIQALRRQHGGDWTHPKTA